MGLADAVAGRDRQVPVELDDATVHVVSIGYRRWRDLMESYPSKDRRKRFDAAKFIPAAIRKCVVECDDQDDLTQFLADARPGEVDYLFGRIVDVHEGKPEERDEDPTPPLG